MIRKWDIDNKVARRACVDEVITRIQEIDDPSAAGMIVAQDIIDIVTENLAPEIYNKGVRDAKKVLNDKLMDIEIDITALEQK